MSNDTDFFIKRFLEFNSIDQSQYDVIFNDTFSQLISIFPDDTNKKFNILLNRADDRIFNFDMNNVYGIVFDQIILDNDPINWNSIWNHMIQNIKWEQVQILYFYNAELSNNIMAQLTSIAHRLNQLKWLCFEKCKFNGLFEFLQRLKSPQLRIINLKELKFDDNVFVVLPKIINNNLQFFDIETNRRLINDQIFDTFIESIQKLPNLYYLNMINNVKDDVEGMLGIVKNMQSFMNGTLRFIAFNYIDVENTNQLQVIMTHSIRAQVMNQNLIALASHEIETQNWQCDNLKYFVFHGNDEYLYNQVVLKCKNITYLLVLNQVITVPEKVEYLYVPNQNFKSSLLRSSIKDVRFSSIEYEDVSRYITMAKYFKSYCANMSVIRLPSYEAINQDVINVLRGMQRMQRIIFLKKISLNNVWANKLIFMLTSIYTQFIESSNDSIISLPTEVQNMMRSKILQMEMMAQECKVPFVWVYTKLPIANALYNTLYEDTQFDINYLTMNAILSTDYNLFGVFNGYTQSSVISSDYDASPEFVNQILKNMKKCLIKR